MPPDALNNDALELTSCTEPSIVLEVSEDVHKKGLGPKNGKVGQRLCVANS
jgi:hypothetical protein